MLHDHACILKLHASPRLHVRSSVCMHICCALDWVQVEGQVVIVLHLNASLEYHCLGTRMYSYNVILYSSWALQILINPELDLVCEMLHSDMQ